MQLLKRANCQRSGTLFLFELQTREDIEVQRPSRKWEGDLLQMRFKTRAFVNSEVGKEGQREMAI